MKISENDAISDLRRGSMLTTLYPAQCASSLENKPLEVGDRVIMASNFLNPGIKTGPLRYLGPTDFAEGEWDRIELDAAIGKNIGSMNEKRYFQC